MKLFYKKEKQKVKSKIYLFPKIFIDLLIYIVKTFTKTKIFFKDKNRSLSPNYSLFDSTSTSNTYEKHKNKFKFHQIIDDSYNINTNIYLKYNKTELINFFFRN